MNECCMENQWSLEFMESNTYNLIVGRYFKYFIYLEDLFKNNVASEIKEKLISIG
jgi:hypothetical protein